MVVCVWVKDTCNLSNGLSHEVWFSIWLPSELHSMIQDIVGHIYGVFIVGNIALPVFGQSLVHTHLIRLLNQTSKQVLDRW